MEIQRLNPSSVASRFHVPFSSHRVTVSSPVDRLVRRMWESFFAFEEFVASEPSSSDHLQVIHADAGWHILRNGNILARCPSLRHASLKVRHATIYSFIAARPDLLWLHAGAVSDGSRSILLVGESGVGKSTFVVELCRRGWSYLSDDVVPIDTETGAAIPFPLTPRVRIRNKSKNHVPQGLRGPGKEWAMDPLDRISTGACPVEGIVLLAFDESSPTGIEPLTDRHAEALLSDRMILHGHDHSDAHGMLTDLACEKPTWLFTHSGDVGGVDSILNAIDPFPESLAV